MITVSVCEAGGRDSEELKKIPFPFPCSPVIWEWSLKKTQLEKKIAIQRVFSKCCCSIISNLYYWNVHKLPNHLHVVNRCSWEDNPSCRLLDTNENVQITKLTPAVHWNLNIKRKNDLNQFVQNGFCFINNAK